MSAERLAAGDDPANDNAILALPWYHDAMSSAVETGHASPGTSKHEGGGRRSPSAFAVRYPMTIAFAASVAAGLSAETLPIPNADIREVVASIIAVASYSIWRYSTSPDASAFEEEKRGPYPPDGVTTSV